MSDTIRQVTTDRIMLAAANLISEDGENSEYDRGVVQVVCDTIGAGLTTDDHDTVLNTLRTINRSSDPGREAAFAAGFLAGCHQERD